MTQLPLPPPLLQQEGLGFVNSPPDFDSHLALLDTENYLPIFYVFLSQAIRTSSEPMAGPCT